MSDLRAKAFWHDAWLQMKGLSPDDALALLGLVDDAGAGAGGIGKGTTWSCTDTAC